MVMKYDGMRYLCELAKRPGVSMPAAKNVDKLERLRVVVRSPSKGSHPATVFCSLLRSNGTRAGFSLPCNAHIASASLVRYVHGGWPYTRVREAE